MNKEEYDMLEKYMLRCMADGDIAHDCHHIYRVLFNALTISKRYDVDHDVLIAACLLHDIGRQKKLAHCKKGHAEIGAQMAYTYLLSIGWTSEKAQHVKACIMTHTYTTNPAPSSIEAKILFDADKLDVMGVIGMVRLVAHNTLAQHPLYSVNEAGELLPGTDGEPSSFMKEYKTDFNNVGGRLHTEYGKTLSKLREEVGLHMYKTFYSEISETYQKGMIDLNAVLSKMYTYF